MRTMMFFFICSLWLPAVHAGSSVYRCIGAAGETVFSQTDCGTDAVAIEARPAQAIGEGLRPTEREALHTIRKAAASQQKAVGATGAVRSEAAVRKQRYRCTRARQQLESVKAERRRGYPAGKGRVLRERQAKYEAYLASFCS
jgi:hypothetical protein